MFGPLTVGGDAILVAAGMLLWLLSTPFVAAHLTRRREVAEPLTDLEAVKGADAIVVLSGDIVHHAPEYGGGATVGPLTLERLRYAAHLQRATHLPVLVTGGRISPWDPPLGEIMARVLAEDFGVDSRWVESESRRTLEHAHFGAPLLRADGVRRICLVTHGLHMERAKLVFEAAGFEVVPAPTRSTARPTGLWRDFGPSSLALYKSAVAIREGLAWFVYRRRYRRSRLGAGAPQPHVR
jgi:uncharacterized SAM-binding protein YcdF (DUF218 family)